MGDIGRSAPILQAIEAFNILPDNAAIGLRSEVRTLTITTQSDTTENVTVTLDGNVKSVAVTDQPAAEVLATGTLTFSAGTDGDDVTHVWVNGINVMALTPEEILGTDHDALATAVAASITAATSSPNYTATAAGAIVTITAVAGSGADPNGYVISATTTGTLTGVGVAMSGGKHIGHPMQTAKEIAAADYSAVGTGWTAVQSGSTVIFTSNDSLASHTGTYSVSGTTIVGAFAQTTGGQENWLDAKNVALFVGTGGNLDVQIGKSRVVFQNIPDGSFLPLLISKLYPTTTTATNIIAMADGTH